MGYRERQPRRAAHRRAGREPRRRHARGVARPRHRRSGVDRRPPPRRPRDASLLGRTGVRARPSGTAEGDGATDGLAPGRRRGPRPEGREADRIGARPDGRSRERSRGTRRGNARIRAAAAYRAPAGRRPAASAPILRSRVGHIANRDAQAGAGRAPVRARPRRAPFARRLRAADRRDAGRPRRRVAARTARAVRKAGCAQAPMGRDEDRGPRRGVSRRPDRRSPVHAREPRAPRRRRRARSVAWEPGRTGRRTGSSRAQRGARSDRRPRFQGGHARSRTAIALAWRQDRRPGRGDCEAGRDRTDPAADGTALRPPRRRRPAQRALRSLRGVARRPRRPCRASRAGFAAEQRVGGGDRGDRRPQPADRGSAGAYGPGVDRAEAGGHRQPSRPGVRRAGAPRCGAACDAHARSRRQARSGRTPRAAAAADRADPVGDRPETRQPASGGRAGRRQRARLDRSRTQIAAGGGRAERPAAFRASRGRTGRKARRPLRPARPEVSNSRRRSPSSMAGSTC